MARRPEGARGSSRIYMRGEASNGGKLTKMRGTTRKMMFSACPVRCNCLTCVGPVLYWSTCAIQSLEVGQMGVDLKNIYQTYVGRLEKNKIGINSNLSTFLFKKKWENIRCIESNMRTFKIIYTIRG